MRFYNVLVVLGVLLQLMGAESHGAVPRLVQSIPADGAKDVPIQLGKIKLFFDQNMKMNSWSLLQTDAHPFPQIHPIEEPWLDPLTFEFDVKELQPNTTYVLQLNGKKRKGFVAADDQSPLPVTLISFTTAADSSMGIQIPDSTVAQQQMPVPAHFESIHKNNTAQISPGWSFEVTRSSGLAGLENYQNGYQAPFRYFQKIIFHQVVTRTTAGLIQDAQRQIQSAEFHRLDTQTGKMIQQELVPKGTRFRVSHDSYGSTLIDGASGKQIHDEELVSTFASPIGPRLWPAGVLRVGQKWSYRNNDLVNRIALIDAVGGQLDLEVQDIKPESTTGLVTAYIRGRLQTKVDLGGTVLDLAASVSIDLPVSVGIPFLVKIEGDLSGAGSIMTENGRTLHYQIKARGTVLQVVKPSNDVLDSTGAIKVDEAKQGAEGNIPLPLTKIPRYTSPPATETGEIYRYRLYQDTTEKAFTVLVPEGWKTEGGILQIPQHQIRTVVDGCGKKLYFSIVDPTTQASITYFPTEMYGSTDPGTSWLQVQPGQVLNGMVQMPQLLSPSEYVRQIVFPQSRHDATNVQWGKRNSLTSLAAAWNKAFHAEDKIPPQVVAESIEVAYDRSGIRVAELWTTLITSARVQNTTIWMPDFTVVAGAPLQVVDKMAPILKAVTTSFRMDSNWMARTIVHFDACTKGVAAAQDAIRAADRRIAKQLRKIQNEIHKIDNEIVGNRNATRSVIQEHEHNTLMGRDKYEDTETGTRYLIDMGYERNFTNGEYLIQTNNHSFVPPEGYRDMKNIHITDE